MTARIPHLLMMSLSLAILVIPAYPNSAVAKALGQNEIGLVAKELSEGIEQCGSVAKAYRVDCMRYAIGDAADATKRDNTAKKANSSLQNLENQLNRLVRKNRDKKAPKLRFNGHQLRAVSVQALPSVNATAGKLLSQTQTILLKASPKEPLRFTRIADALDSGKVLLRSA